MIGSNHARSFQAKKDPNAVDTAALARAIRLGIAIGAAASAAGYFLGNGFTIPCAILGVIPVFVAWWRSR